MPRSPQREARSRTRVVVVGGGFAGLQAARTLAAGAGPEVDIVLVDRRNHHLFQPLLYQVATAGLSPADISMPIRSVLAPYRNVSVRLGEVFDVDIEKRVVHADTGRIPYDYLVLACGATHSYFGHDEWEEHAPGLKTLEQATEIRRRVLTAFELAELENEPGRRRELLTFVIVGGGPTGVELAGALGELSRHTLSNDFRKVDPSGTRVILIEGGPRILSMFEPELSRSAARSLEELGVTIWTDTSVTHIDGHGVRAGEEYVRAATVLWAAGVNASPLGRVFGLPLDNAGRVPVEPDLSLAGHREVFVLGDQARFMSEGHPLPGLAPVAIQQGRACARNILADLRERTREPFVYFDKGTMATIGRANAVAQTEKLKLDGFAAWLAWCFIHILYLVGFRNRMLVLLQWMWSYIRYRRGARLITNREWQLDEPEIGVGEQPDGPEEFHDSDVPPTEHAAPPAAGAGAHP
ncbi:MAG: NAD(P)/FAD-dependent oxidoreductase [Deltaproteobacteria bacterium]|nr:NAD(P)/FAD-dependent oxidoreductase [Nannocystaceae bacterium]